MDRSPFLIDIIFLIAFLGILALFIRRFRIRRSQDEKKPAAAPQVKTKRDPENKFRCNYCPDFGKPELHTLEKI
jgi:hypothetical protein